MPSVEPKDLPTPEALIDDPIRRADYYHNVIVTVLGIRRNDFPGGIDGFLVLAAGAARVLRGQVINVTTLSAATGFSRRKVRRLRTVLRDEKVITYDDGLTNILPTEHGTKLSKTVLTWILTHSNPLGLGHYYTQEPDRSVEPL